MIVFPVVTQNPQTYQTIDLSVPAPAQNNHAVEDDDDVILIPQNIPLIDLCDSPALSLPESFNTNSQLNHSGILECLVLHGPNENRPLLRPSRRANRARRVIANSPPYVLPTIEILDNQM